MMDEETIEKVRAALVELESDGRITPDNVVDAARNPKSPLHDQFEWDDSAAAHGFRLEQARRLIRSITVVITHEQSVLRVPTWVRDPAMGGSEQGYVSVLKLSTEPENAARAIASELARVDSCLERTERIASVLGLLREVKATRKRVAKMRETVAAQIQV